MTEHEEQAQGQEEAAEFIGPPVPEWSAGFPAPAPVAEAAAPPPNPVWMRAKLLLLGGVAAPVGMALVGMALAWFLRGEVLWQALGRAGAPGALAAGVVLSAAVSMSLIALLAKTSDTFARAIRKTGVKAGEDALKMAGYPVMYAIVAMAGFGEEMLFRGGLQPTVGIIPAALLFGFSHGGWRKEMWAYAVAAAGAGVVFGLAYRLTGDIWVPIIGHAIHNVLTVLLLGRKLRVTLENRKLEITWVPEEEEE